MKKVTLLSLFIFFLGIAYGQTLNETKQWIANKLNRYQKEPVGMLANDCYAKGVSQNFYSRFDKDTLVISCDVKVFFPKCFLGDKKKTEKQVAKKMIYRIPISDLFEIVNTGGMELTIYTELETIRVIAITEIGNYQSFSQSIKMGFNFNTEKDLFERLKKAFVRLKEFYPEKKSKEAF